MVEGNGGGSGWGTGWGIGASLEGSGLSVDEAAIVDGVAVTALVRGLASLVPSLWLGGAIWLGVAWNEIICKSGTTTNGKTCDD